MLPEDTPNPPEGYEWEDNFLTKKKKSFMQKGTDSLRNMTKNMKTGDWIFLLGTLGLAAANPKGRGGQAKVIQHNLDKSRELGLATAKSALSRVRNYVIPKLQKNETDVIAMREFITKDLRGVDPRIIQNIIKAGPVAFERFRKEIEDLQQYHIDNGAKLKPHTINNLFNDVANLESADGVDLNKLLDQKYRGHMELLNSSKSPSEYDAGVFGAMYGDPNSALKESAKYLKMAGNIPVGNRSFDYSQLDTLDPSQIGFDMASADTMADYDITKGMSDPTNSKIEEKVGKKILLLLNAIGSSETAQASFSDIFRQNMFPNDWDGNPDKLDFDIPNDTDGTIKGRMNTIAQAGKNVFSLLWLQSDNKQKLQQDFANMMDTYAQTSSDNKLIFRATDFLNIANINKDTVFNNRAALKIFVNVMDETAELLPGTQLQYKDANGIVQTVLIEDVIRGTF
tara:strand:+ start:754 stop:2115 length:1362 start_codon:yes stop_codon:yes gene_type:complete